MPPQYVSSTEASLKVTWSAPAFLYGCPLINYNLYINDGQGGPVDTIVAVLEPHINYLDILSFVEDVDTSKQYLLTIEAVTAAGSVLSGTNQFILANTPQKPSVV